MLKRIVLIGVFLLMFSLADGICGDGICEANENSENCCIDCGCGFGEICENNTCVQKISFFSFSTEISLFLLIIIFLFAGFVISYGLNIVRKAHKKTKRHFKKIEECNSNIDLLTTNDIETKIIDYIKKGKTIKEVRKILQEKGISKKLLDKLIIEVLEKLVSDAEQNMLELKWNPYLINSVFKEIMGLPKELRKKEKEKIEKKIKKIKKPTLKDILKNVKNSKSNELKNYIGISLARGYSPSKIKENLLKAGWDEKDIMSELKQFL